MLTIVEYASKGFDLEAVKALFREYEAFKEIAPYNENSNHDVYYMERELGVSVPSGLSG